MKRFEWTLVIKSFSLGLALIDRLHLSDTLHRRLWSCVPAQASAAWSLNSVCYEKGSCVPGVCRPWNRRSIKSLSVFRFSLFAFLFALNWSISLCSMSLFNWREQNWIKFFGKTYQIYYITVPKFYILLAYCVCYFASQWQNTLANRLQKGKDWASEVAQVLECLPSKHKFKPQYLQKKMCKEKKEEWFILACDFRSYSPWFLGSITLGLLWDRA
jgi:hypothetical protein